MHSNNTLCAFTDDVLIVNILVECIGYVGYTILCR